MEELSDEWIILINIESFSMFFVTDKLINVFLIHYQIIIGYNTNLIKKNHIKINLNLIILLESKPFDFTLFLFQ